LNQAHQPIVGRLCLPLAVLALSGATLAQSVRPQQPPAQTNSDAKLPAAPVMKTAANLTRPTPTNVATPAKTQSLQSVSHRALRNQLFMDAPGDGSVWARGMNYKASFDGQGFTYIPYLGGNAPQNYPLNMRVASVTAGGQRLAFDAQAAPTQNGNSVSFARSAFTETYDMTAADLEQSFTFQSLPASGDLVIRMNVDSELSGRATSNGLEFSNELGSVHYGQAITIDATGRRTPATTTFDGSSVTIRVDGSTLSESSFPITVDPVVTTFTIDGTTLDDFLPDTAYDNASSSWLTVYEEVFSTTDHDVYSERIDNTGAVLNGGYIDFTGNYWQTPAVANNLVAAKWLVVAAVGLPTSGARIISSRTVANVGFVFGAQTTVSSTVDSGDKFHPDVGGDQFGSAPSWFMVVWERDFGTTDHDIHGATVDNMGAISGTIYIDNSGGTFDALPSISKSDQTSNWAVAWQRTFSATDHDIYGAIIGFSGAINSPTFNIDFTGNDDTNVSVSSPLNPNTAVYVVACQRDFGTDMDIIAFLMNGTAVTTSTDVSVADASNFLEDQVEPSVDSDGTDFAVVFSESFMGSTTDYDIYVDQLTATLAIGEDHTNLAFSGDPEHNPEIGSRQGSGGTATHFMAVWDDAFSATDRDIFGAFWDIGPATMPGSITSFCPGDGSGTQCPCGNNGTAGHGCANSINPAGALLAATGNPSVSNDTVTLTGSGIQATAPGLFFQGTTSLAPGVVFGDGLRCAGGTIIRLASHTASGGIVSYPVGADQPIHIKGAVNVGDTRYYQLWYRNAGAFCTSATFNLTNGIQIVWGT